MRLPAGITATQLCCVAEAAGATPLTLVCSIATSTASTAGRTAATPTGASALRPMLPVTRLKSIAAKAATTYFG